MDLPDIDVVKKKISFSLSQNKLESSFKAIENDLINEEENPSTDDFLTIVPKPTLLAKQRLKSFSIQKSVLPIISPLAKKIKVIKPEPIIPIKVKCNDVEPIKAKSNRPADKIKDTLEKLSKFDLKPIKYKKVDSAKALIESKDDTAKLRQLHARWGSDHNSEKYKDNRYSESYKDNHRTSSKDIDRINPNEVRRIIPHEIHRINPEIDKVKHLKDKTYPENWQIFCDRGLDLDGFYKTHVKVLDTRPDDAIKILSFSSKPFQLNPLAYQNMNGDFVKLPSTFLRYTKKRPKLSYGANPNKSKQQYFNRNTVLNYVSSSIQKSINLIINSSTSEMPKTAQFPIKNRKWFPKLILPDNEFELPLNECEVLENSLGLSSLQTYEDDDDKSDDNLKTDNIHKPFELEYDELTQDTEEVEVKFKKKDKKSEKRLKKKERNKLKRKLKEKQTKKKGKKKKKRKSVTSSSDSSSSSSSENEEEVKSKSKKKKSEASSKDGKKKHLSNETFSRSNRFEDKYVKNKHQRKSWREEISRKCVDKPEKNIKLTPAKKVIDLEDFSTDFSQIDKMKSDMNAFQLQNIKIEKIDEPNVVIATEILEEIYFQATHNLDKTSNESSKKQPIIKETQKEMCTESELTNHFEELSKDKSISPTKSVQELEGVIHPITCSLEKEYLRVSPSKSYQLLEEMVIQNCSKSLENISNYGPKNFDELSPIKSVQKLENSETIELNFKSRKSRWSENVPIIIIPEICMDFSSNSKDIDNDHDKSTTDLKLESSPIKNLEIEIEIIKDIEISEKDLSPIKNHSIGVDLVKEDSQICEKLVASPTKIVKELKLPTSPIKVEIIYGKSSNKSNLDAKSDDKKLVTKNRSKSRDRASKNKDQDLPKRIDKPIKDLLQKTGDKIVKEEKGHASKNIKDAPKNRDKTSKDRDKASKDRDKASKDRDKTSKDRDKTSKDRDTSRNKRSKDRSRDRKSKSKERDSLNVSKNSEKNAKDLSSDRNNKNVSTSKERERKLSGHSRDKSSKDRDTSRNEDKRHCKDRHSKDHESSDFSRSSERKSKDRLSNDRHKISSSSSEREKRLSGSWDRKSNEHDTNRSRNVERNDKDYFKSKDRSGDSKSMHVSRTTDRISMDKGGHKSKDSYKSDSHKSIDQISNDKESKSKHIKSNDSRIKDTKIVDVKAKDVIEIGLKASKIKDIEVPKTKDLSKNNLLNIELPSNDTILKTEMIHNIELPIKEDTITITPKNVAKESLPVIDEKVTELNFKDRFPKVQSTELKSAQIPNESSTQVIEKVEVPPISKFKSKAMLKSYDDVAFKLEPVVIKQEPGLVKEEPDLVKDEQVVVKKEPVAKRVTNKPNKKRGNYVNEEKELGTPDTDEYHSHWESDEEQFATPTFRKVDTWESDEDGRYNSRDAFRKYNHQHRSLEMPLNLNLNASRSRTPARYKQQPGLFEDFEEKPGYLFSEDSWERGEYLKYKNDLEIEELERARRSLSEERKLLEIEKKKMAEMEKRVGDRYKEEKCYGKGNRSVSNESVNFPKKNDKEDAPKSYGNKANTLEKIKNIEKIKEPRRFSEISKDKAVSNCEVIVIKDDEIAPIVITEDEIIPITTKIEERPSRKGKWEENKATSIDLPKIETPVIKSSILEDEYEQFMLAVTSSAPEKKSDSPKRASSASSSSSSDSSDSSDSSSSSSSDSSSSDSDTAEVLPLNDKPKPVPSPQKLTVTTVYGKNLSSFDTAISSTCLLKDNFELTPDYKLTPKYHEVAMGISADSTSSPLKANLLKNCLESNDLNASVDSVLGSEIDLENRKPINAITLPKKQALDKSAFKDSDESDTETKSKRRGSLISAIPAKVAKSVEVVPNKDVLIVKGVDAGKVKELQKRRHSQSPDKNKKRKSVRESYRREPSPKRRRSSPGRSPKRLSPRRSRGSPVRKTQLVSPRRRRDHSPRRRYSPHRSPRHDTKRGLSPLRQPTRRDHSPNRHDSHRGLSPRHDGISRRDHSPPRRDFRRSLSPIRRRRFSRSSSKERKIPIQETLQRLANPSSYEHVNKSPNHSPLDGFKRSLADSTISDDQLLQANQEDSYADSPASYNQNKYYPSVTPILPQHARLLAIPVVESPKRMPLDDRINQVLGLEKEPELPKPITTTFGNYGYNRPYYDQYAQQDYEGKEYTQQDHHIASSLSNNKVIIPSMSIQPTNCAKVVQVGNMLQVVPIEEITKIGIKQEIDGSQQILQVGNMLQIVPTTIQTLQKEAVCSSPEIIKIVEADKFIAIKDKMSAEDLMKIKIAERKAEREKRRLERVSRRTEKEKKQKEREKKKQTKLKQKTEDMIKRALLIDIDGAEEAEPEKNWPPACPVTLNTHRPTGKGILICKSTELEDAIQKLERKKKGVKFADGVIPGEGTSPSGGEELSSPPPETKKIRKEKRFTKTQKPKRVKKTQKKKVKVKIIRKSRFEDDSEDYLPPPSPPPGSPPPHVYPARIKPINNHHPNFNSSLPPPVVLQPAPVNYQFSALGMPPPPHKFNMHGGPPMHPASHCGPPPPHQGHRPPHCPPPMHVPHGPPSHGHHPPPHHPHGPAPGHSILHNIIHNVAHIGQSHHGHHHDPHHHGPHHDPHHHGHHHDPHHHGPHHDPHHHGPHHHGHHH